MNRYISPALLVAVNGFKRSTEQIGHLFLGFIQAIAVFFKFAFIHIMNSYHCGVTGSRKKCYIVVFYFKPASMNRGFVDLILFYFFIKRTAADPQL